MDGQLKNEDTTELMLKILMPTGAGGLVLTLTLLLSVFIMDKFIFNRDVGNIFILILGFGINILGSIYSFDYSYYVLGYFNNSKKITHIIILVIIPFLLGLIMAYQGYQSRLQLPKG